jgi:hypothetical protein
VQVIQSVRGNRLESQPDGVLQLNPFKKHESIRWSDVSRFRQPGQCHALGPSWSSGRVKISSSGLVEIFPLNLPQILLLSKLSIDTTIIDIAGK